MTETSQDFELYTGDNAILEITVYKDGTTSPKNLTCASVLWVLYNDDTDEVLVRKTLASGITMVNEANGRINIEIVPADTTGLSPTKNYKHLVVVVDDTKNVSTVLEGTIKIYRGMS